MPSTIIEIEQFALATVDGQDCGYVTATIEVDYFRNGAWSLVDVGLTAEWRDEDGRWQSRVVWDLPVDLVIRLQHQAKTRHRADIDEAVWAECDAVYGSAGDPNAEHRLTYGQVA